MTALWIVLAALAGVLVGAVAMAKIIGKTLEGQDYDDEPSDEQQMLNAKVEEAAARRIEDAQRMVNVMENAANVLLRAAQTEKAAADALIEVRDEQKRTAAEIALLRQTLDGLDAGVGSLVNAFTNSGLMKTVQFGPGGGSLRQHGEPSEQSPPPLFERDRNKPLDDVIR